ncbi:LPXTG cell wall anchor domain-containing protein, partial [Lactococcus lactis]
NNSNQGEVIKAGTKVSIDVTSPISKNKFLTLRGIQSTSGYSDYFSYESTDNSFIITLDKDLKPGDYNIYLYFSIENPGYNWDGKNNTDNPAIMTASLNSKVLSAGKSIDLPISPDKLFIRPVAKGPVGGLAGYMNGGYNGNNVDKNGNVTVSNGYPSNFIKSNSSGVWFNPSVSKVNDKFYQTYIGSYLPAQLGVGNTAALGKGVISFNFDHPVDVNSVKVELSYTMTGSLPAQDITNADGVNLYISDDKKSVSVDFTDYLQNKGTFLVNQWRTVDLMVAVPTDLDTDVIKGDFNLQYPGTNWKSTFSGIYTSGTNNINFPYFRGGNATIYNTESYNPLTNVHTYVNDELDDKNITITDLDGYPASGYNPSPGVYKISYQTTFNDSEGNPQTVKYSRTITVLENKQSITGSDYSMTLGDKEPTISDFKASATDKDGNPLDVTADFSKVDFTKVGTYNVVLNTTDGQSKTVKLAIKENKQSITGSDYSMILGDKEPTVSDFKASATDKDGNPLDVTADFSKVDFTKVGTYDVVLNTTDGQSKTVKLAIKENKQSITGSDYSMILGDKEPTASDFKASATDKDGNPLDVTADFSKVDFTKAGTYDVVLNTTDGQSKTVKLAIKENKQSITGSDYNMTLGDKEPTVSDFKASATDKDGNPLDVTADFSKVDFTKAGTYDVVLNTTDGQSKIVKLTIKNNKSTVIDHNNKDKGNPSSGKNILSDNSKVSLPSTGEQKTNLFYGLGAMLVVLALTLCGGLKKLRRKN